MGEQLGTREIPLSQGKVAIVDAADYEWLNQWKWTAAIGKHTTYAYRAEQKDKCRKVYHMHRLIMQVSAPLHVDHINHNGIDNRRQNLRVATGSENSRNQRAHRDSTSKYLGVFWDKARGMWRSEIAIGDNKRKFLGRFTSEIEAARAYDTAAREIHGAFANPNFPRTA